MTLLPQRSRGLIVISLVERFESMRVFLTKPELATHVGTYLLQLCLQNTDDGKLDLAEIKTLRKWLRANKDDTSVAAVSYLYDII